LSSDDSKKQWTVIKLINWTTEYLVEKKFEDARLQTELLLSHALNLSRIELYTNFDRPLNPDELAHFKNLLKRRLANEPLQYITGETEFYSLSFHVRPSVLVPRPETEILVEKAIAQAEKITFDNINILDVGTGSGCIAVALAKNLENAHVTSVDISPDALQVARENAEKNNVEIDFVNLDALKPWPIEFARKFDIIVSNPPYVSYSEFEALAPEIKEYEPKVSLLGGNDGLEFYRKFANILTDILKPSSFAFFEIGEKQASSVSNIFADAGFQNIQVLNDLAGKNRVVKMTWNRSASI